MRQLTVGWPPLPRGPIAAGVAVLVMIAALGACERSTIYRGVHIAQHSEEQGWKTVRSFVAAIVSNDSSALDSLATRSVVRQVGEDRAGRYSVEYSGAEEGVELKRAVAVICGSDVWFNYRVAGETHLGRAEVRMDSAGTWRVVEFSLLVAVY